MESSEKDPLLVNTASIEKAQVPDSKPTFSWFQYICVILVMFLYAVATIVQSNVIPLYIYDRFKNEYSDNTTAGIGGSNESATNFPNRTEVCGSNSSKSQDEAQVMSSTWLWYFKMSSYGGLLFVIPITGLLTDVVGRKPFLLLSLIGTLIRYLIKGYIIYQNYDVVYLFIPYVVEGLTGSSASFQVAVLAFISDLTPPGKSRSFHIAMYDLAIGIGEAIAQLGAGYLIQDTGYVIPCLVASGLCLLCSLITILILTESVSEIQRKTKHSVLDSIRRLVGFYHSKEYLKDNSPVWKFNLTVFIYIVFMFPMSSSLNTLYELGSPFCWKAKDIGLFTSISCIIIFIVGVAFLKLLQACLRDETIGALGCVSSVGEKLLFYFANSSWMLYAASGVGIIHILPLPVLRGNLSRMVLEEQHGAVFANLSIIGILLDMGSVSALNNIYNLTEQWKRGFVYLVMCGFFTIAGLLFIPLICSKATPIYEKEVLVTVEDEKRSQSVP